MRRIAVDTGPLVALLNSRDAHHQWARESLEATESPLLTCEAVLSEACFLVRKLKGGPEAVLGLVRRGVVEPSFRLDAEIDAVRRLIMRYASVPMSLADACLVRMAELDSRLTVMTLDGDFRIYRKNRRQAIPLLSPER